MRKVIILLMLIMAVSCTENGKKPDAYGNFEATEILISSEVDGRLLVFNVDEGMNLSDGQIIGLVDTTQLNFKREQLYAQKYAITSRVNNVFSQIAVLQEQRDNALNDKKRIEFLFKDGAATQKEMDDINSRIAVIDKQITSIETQNQTIVNEVKAIDAQIGQVNDFLRKCVLKNPVQGTVLNKFVEQNELVNMGKPLYKIADLNTMTLRAYFTGDQLSNLQLDQKVEVLVDQGISDYKKMVGIVSWISPKAEFTPKSIQTREERATMVYAVKIKVKNENGYLKIGMPGEVKFYYKEEKK